MDIEPIRAKIRAGRYILSFTHTEKIRLRKIGAEEIEEAIYTGNVIEPYPDDPRGPIVCGRLEKDEILIITAYEPDPNEWEEDWKTRKKGE